MGRLEKLRGDVLARCPDDMSGYAYAQIRKCLDAFIAEWEEKEVWHSGPIGSVPETWHSTEDTGYAGRGFHILIPRKPVAERDQLREAAEAVLREWSDVTEFNKRLDALAAALKKEVEDE
jgi:hypothetical protein